MRLRIKKTGEVVDAFSIDARNYETIKIQYYTKDGVLNHFSFDSLEKMNDVLEDYKPAEPLIKDEKIRKAVRAWAEANGFSVFKVYNQHFNYVKIHGVKDRYDPNGSNIEFMGTIAGAEKRAYEIDELCGEEEE